VREASDDDGRERARAEYAYGMTEREPSTQPESYEDAVGRLEQIIDRLDSGQAGLRETLELCKEGRELVNYCSAELDAVGEGLKELRLDELAEKLDASAAG
jgi:exodeoxyribonuclease VII small subunit